MKLYKFVCKNCAAERETNIWSQKWCSKPLCRAARQRAYYLVPPEKKIIRRAYKTAHAYARRKTISLEEASRIQGTWHLLKDYKEYQKGHIVLRMEAEKDRLIRWGLCLTCKVRNSIKQSLFCSEHQPEVVARKVKDVVSTKPVSWYKSVVKKNQLKFVAAPPRPPEVKRRRQKWEWDNGVMKKKAAT